MIRIVSYTSGRAKELGTVRLDAEGKILYDGKLPPGVKEVVEDAYDRAKSPEEFMRYLPQQFTGAYIRAMRVPDRETRAV